MGSASTDPASPETVPADQLAAFTAELASKSDLIWVSVDHAPARAVWHVWHDGAFAVVTGGLEQPDSGLREGAQVEVTLRSKENRARQLRVPATVTRVEPRSDGWDAAVAALHPKRLNAPDGEEQPARWARESSVWLIRPAGAPLERPGAMSADAHRATPVPTPAITLDRTPFHAGRATRKRR
jgi:hypothetical protein